MALWQSDLDLHWSKGSQIMISLECCLIVQGTGKAPLKFKENENELMYIKEHISDETRD